MKILLISDFFPRGKDLKFSGGVEARTFFLAKNLSKNHKVTIICSRQPKTKSSETMFGFKILRVGPELKYTSGASSFSETPKRLKFILKAIETAKKLDVDIVDGGNFNDHFIASRTGKFKNIPVVFWYPDVFLGQWIKTSGLIAGFVGYLVEKYNLFTSADKFIAISKTTRNKLINSGVDQNKIKVIYCGVDHKEFLNSIQKDKIPQIVCVSRLVDYKNIKDLILAFAFLKRKYDELNLLIIGSGPRKNDLKKLASELNLSKNIEFKENLSRAKLIKKIKESKLFVLPSSVEGFGISVIEAAAAGIPYVVSDIPVLKEVTRGGKGGLLFKLASPKDLADKAERLLRDNSLYKKKSIEAKNLAKLYDWRHITSETEEVYKSLINNK